MTGAGGGQGGLRSTLRRVVFELADLGILMGLTLMMGGGGCGAGAGLGLGDEVGEGNGGGLGLGMISVCSSSNSQADAFEGLEQSAWCRAPTAD